MVKNYDDLLLKVFVLQSFHCWIRKKFFFRETVDITLFQGAQDKRLMVERVFLISLCT
jgi:hypothetical protein